MRFERALVFELSFLKQWEGVFLLLDLCQFDFNNWYQSFIEINKQTERRELKKLCWEESYGGSNRDDQGEGDQSFKYTMSDSQYYKLHSMEHANESCTKGT